MSIINDIARRLGKLKLDSAAWQVQRLQESGLLYDEIITRLAALTGQSEEVLRQTFANAGVKALKFDDAIYKRAGLNPIPLHLSPVMLDVLRAGIEKTGGLIRNLTMTTAISGQEAFISAADLAYMQVSTGTMSYTQAIREAVKSVFSQGLSVIQYAGRKDQLDVAVRRAVLTGVGQTTGKLQMARADEMGCDLVQTSAHAGARPAHQVWQGQVFSRSGKSREYPNFVETTGYGTPGGLNGINCRHSWYPFFEGISENAYTERDVQALADKKVNYHGREITQYEASQVQRGIERKIRKAKREASALDAAGLDNGPEMDQVRARQAEMRDFIRQTGMQRQRQREWAPKLVPSDQVDPDQKHKSNIGINRS